MNRVALVMAASLACNGSPEASTVRIEAPTAPAQTEPAPIDASVAATADAPDAGNEAFAAHDDSARVQGSLSSDVLIQVVQANRVSVKRRCWERMDDAGAAVSVKVRVKVGADGSVRSATASGNDDNVARCIERVIESWRFPGSTGSTDFEVPFRFVRP